MNYMDLGGKEIKPKGDKEVNMIRNTVPLDARQYIQVGQNGMISKELLSQYSGNSGNFSSLKEIASSQTIVSVSLDNSFSYVDSQGNTGVSFMSYIPFDPSYPEDKDINFEHINMLSTGESGFMGKTLFPDRQGMQNSPSDEINIIINSGLSNMGAAESFSHEAYGHALLYLKNGNDHNGASHQTVGMEEKNMQLKEMILEARRETVNNMKQ